MRYLLLIYADQTTIPAPGTPEAKMIMKGHFDLQTDMKAAGVYLGSDRLVPAEFARTVKTRDGNTITTDGPFTETKEQFGGYYLVEADSIDAAQTWAEKIPGGEMTMVEIRQIVDMPPPPATS